MTAHALDTHAGQEPAQVEPARPVEPAHQLSTAEMAEANINPSTGLATDYLNHFNEAIMMLELIPSMPACIDDLMDWNVMTYREHFLATTQKHRDAVLVAYDTADPQARVQLDEIADTMSSILSATRDALRLDLSPTVAAGLAREAAFQLKPLVARAGAVINGLKVSGDIPLAGVAQAAVDAILRGRS